MFQSGLKVGDMILAINTETFIGINYDEAVAIIKSLGGNVKMLVTSPREEEANKVAGVTSAEARPPLQPRRESEVKPLPAAASTSSQAAPDKPGAAKTPKKEAAPAVEKEKPKEEETKVELTKDSSGVGFSIVGGTDTPLVSFKSSSGRQHLIMLIFRDASMFTRFIKAGRQRKAEN